MRSGKSKSSANPIDSPSNSECVMNAPMLGSSPFKIGPSESLPAPLSPETPSLPHVFRPNSFLTDSPPEGNPSNQLAVTQDPKGTSVAGVAQW